MMKKRILAFFCAVVLFAAVAMAPVSAAEITGKTDNGMQEGIWTKARLIISPGAAQASTTYDPEADPPPAATTDVTARCHSAITGTDVWVSASGGGSAFAYRPDTSYVVWNATSVHSVSSGMWGIWYTSLSEVIS